MLKKIGMKALGVFMVLCGIGMIEMGFRDPDFELPSRIFSAICGLIMMLGGLLVSGLFFAVLDKLNERKKAGGLRGAGGKEGAKEMLKELKSEVSPNFLAVREDRDDTERLVRGFRRDYAAFFEHPGFRENDPVQNEATQICWHTLYLQKRRLDRKKIVSRTESERLRYGSLDPVRKRTVFDGKYGVTDVTETIEADQIFLDTSGKKVWKEKCLQAARFRILSAKKAGNADLIVCPGCGHASPREDLIDGCDYCGTKFTVEDLGSRVSEFCFRPDYEVEYAHYTDTRKTYGKRVGLIVGIPVFLLGLVITLFNAEWYEGSLVLNLAALIFAAGFPAFAAVFFAEILFFMFLFPFIQAKASVTYMRKKGLDRLKKQESRDSSAEQHIRSVDPLFSMGGFYAGIQNKLAVIHFAENAGDAAAFADGPEAERQIAERIPGYADVIKMDTESVQLEGYRVNGGLQEAGVTAELRLVSETGGRAFASKENVRLKLVKSASCRTQADCAPVFMKCGGCGAPLSLLEGRICPHCGRARTLSEYDWAVRSYETF